MGRGSDQTGFSLVEVLIATCVLLLVLAIVFDAVNPAREAFRTESESADQTQRLRVAVDVMSRELLATGAGADRGPHTGALEGFFAAVLPFREGRRNADPPGTFKTDTVTLIRVMPGAAQTSIAQAMAAQSGSAQLNLEPGCPVGDASCGFKTGMTVLLFDDTGSYDLFNITAVNNLSLALQHNQRDSSKIYAPHATAIVEASIRTYYLKTDSATDTFQLVQYDGAGGADVPVVDHVVGFSLEYFGDPQPPRMIKPRTDPLGPWTTYGPAPPPESTQTTAFPPGENCAFVSNGTPTPSPRLAVLSADARLVRLHAGELTDGPWCPDPSAPNRFDADLLRVRAVGVVIRVEAAAAILRGVGLDFLLPGRSRDGRMLVPDQEVRIEIAPPNLNLWR